MLFKVTNKDNKGNAIYIQGAYSKSSTNDIAAITFQNYDEDTKSIYNIASISARDSFGTSNDNGKGELLFLTNTTGCNATGLTEKARITNQGSFCLGSNVPMSNSLFSVYGSSFFTSNVTVDQQLNVSNINATSGYIASFSVCNLSFSNLSTPSIDVQDLAVSSNVTVSNNLYVLNTAYIASNLTLSNDLYVINDLVVSSNTTINNNLTVNNDQTVLSNATVCNDLTVGNDLYVSKRLIIYSKNYTGPAPQVQSFAAFSAFEPQLMAFDVPTVVDTLTFSNDAYFTSNVTCSNNLYVVNDNYITNKLVVSSNVTFCNDLLTFGNTTVNSNSVVGNDLFVFGSANVFTSLTTSNFTAVNLSILNDTFLGVNNTVNTTFINGTLAINSHQSNATISINQDGTGDMIVVSKSNQSKFVVSACNGWVGIGKSNPQVALDINGDINFTGNISQNGHSILNKPVSQLFPRKRLTKQQYELALSWLHDTSNVHVLQSVDIMSCVIPSMYASSPPTPSNIYYDLRVYDKTNNRVLSQIRLSNIIPSLNTLMLSNQQANLQSLTNPSIFEIHGRLGPNAKEMQIDNVQLIYT